MIAASHGFTRTEIAQTPNRSTAAAWRSKEFAAMASYVMTPFAVRAVTMKVMIAFLFLGAR